jgi:hypothetical protein
MSALKPCPLCGGRAVYDECEKTNDTMVRCPDCGAWGPLGGRSCRPGAPDAEAAAAWNRRPTEDALRAERDAALADAAGWKSYAAAAAKLDTTMSASHDAEIEAWRNFGLDIVKLLASPGAEGCEAPDVGALACLRDDVMGLVAERDRLRTLIAEAADDMPIHPEGAHLTPLEADAEAVRQALLAALRGEA